MPLLSLIIPFRNRVELFIETLNSVINQQVADKNDIEIILVDNNSHSHTRENIESVINMGKEKNWQISVVKELTEGASAARNKGIKVSSAPWILFFDSDDIMLPGHLESVIREISNYNKNVDLLYWDILLETPDRKTYRKSSNNIDICHDVIINSIWSTDRYTVRRDVIYRIGMWNEELMAWNDWELAIRYLCNDIRVKKINDEPKILVKSHNDSITGSNFSLSHLKWERALEVAREYALKKTRYDIANWIDIKTAMLGGIYANEGNKTLALSILRKILAESNVSKWMLKTAFLIQKYIGSGASYPYLLLSKLM